jgi:hypothetical protein
MRYAAPTRTYNPNPSHFKRGLLPGRGEYFKSQGLRLAGGGEWKSALCTFHINKKPSLRVRIDSGGFRCRACRRHGGDVVGFHMQLHGLGFIEAVKDLGAWGYDHD